MRNWRVGDWCQEPTEYLWVYIDRMINSKWNRVLKFKKIQLGIKREHFGSPKPSCRNTEAKTLSTCAERKALKGGSHKQQNKSWNEVFNTGNIQQHKFSQWLRDRPPSLARHSQVWSLCFLPRLTKTEPETLNQFGIIEPKQMGYILEAPGAPFPVLSAASQIPAVASMASSITASTHFTLIASCPRYIMCFLLSDLQFSRKKSLLSLYTSYRNFLHDCMVHLESGPKVLSRQQYTEHH